MSSVCPVCCEEDRCLDDCTYYTDDPDGFVGMCIKRESKATRKRLDAAVQERLASVWSAGYRAGTLDPPNFRSDNPFAEGEE